jgi:2-polyprenyl-3-methyl-5-hydroxy-6-metoxy-1,4-benzoquinol methylase
VRSELQATNQQDLEVRAGERFEFGANWARFLRLIDPSRIELAQDSLKSMLGMGDLTGRTFLDAGSGSGLFSLAARRLGARVHSFDYDPQSVACTRELKRRYFAEDPRWVVESGSVLDRDYLQSLGRFDVVYSWGVLHHTGDMNAALANVAELVAPGGTLFIALYNDQGWISNYWSRVKRQWNHHRALRPLLTAVHAPYLVAAPWLVRTLSGRGQMARGMSLWYDMFDWLGGWPFETATPGQIVSFYERLGFTPRQVRTVGRRLGCNEFVFARSS